MAEILTRLENHGKYSKCFTRITSKHWGS